MDKAFLFVIRQRRHFGRPCWMVVLQNAGTLRIHVYDDTARIEIAAVEKLNRKKKDKDYGERNIFRRGLVDSVA